MVARVSLPICIAGKFQLACIYIVVGLAPLILNRQELVDRVMLVVLSEANFILFISVVVVCYFVHDRQNVFAASTSLLQGRKRYRIIVTFPLQQAG
jgi:hypothetical protein